MRSTDPTVATTLAVRQAIQAARSEQNFLSVYLPTEPAEALSSSFRLRLTALLNEEQTRQEGNKAFQAERENLEKLAPRWKSAGYGLAVLSSAEAWVWQAFWLPGPVAAYARYGRGAYVLPLLDALDEWEPVALAQVARDTARLQLFATGQAEAARHIESYVTGQNRAGGGTATTYSGSGGNQAAQGQRQGGGGAANHRERHQLAQVEGHLKRVVHELEEMRQQHGFKRFFVAGPTESVALFKRELPPEMSHLLAGDLSLGIDASDGEIRQKVLQAAQEAERSSEGGLVEELITRAEKQQGAVLGAAAVTWAVNRWALRQLILASDARQPGGYCEACGLLLPPEDIRCPQCDARPQRVDLEIELPRLALEREIPLEIIHADAASRLAQHDGMAGLLNPPPAH